MTRRCDPREIALKSFFLGPQAENAPWLRDLLEELFDAWVGWRRSLFPGDGNAISRTDQRTAAFARRRKTFERASRELMARFEAEVPKFSPRYVGHMFSEIGLPALIGHIVTLFHNPNNISGESSRVGTEIEREAIAALCGMLGFRTAMAAGHFTSGGTLANLEALVRAQARAGLWLSLGASLKAAGLEPSLDWARASHLGWERFGQGLVRAQAASSSLGEMRSWDRCGGDPRATVARLERLAGHPYPGPVILVPDHKHYSWQKGCRLLGLGSEALWPVRLDEHGRLSDEHLEETIRRAVAEGRSILLVVSVAGTTELGGIDPVHRVQDLLDRWKASEGIHLWHHVDAAYGGFFRTVSPRRMAGAFGKEAASALRAIARVDSVTLDPHKLGYVPYASGAFLTRDRKDYYFSTFEEAPYIDFDARRDRGPYTIEGSRSAAGAVATWMSARTMGLDPKGYGLLLERTVRTRKRLARRLAEAGLPVQLANGCDTNILCFTCAAPGERLSDSNRRTLAVFEAFSPEARPDFIVSKTVLSRKSYGNYLDRWTGTWAAERDDDQVVVIRMCLMNPFFDSAEARVDFAEEFVARLGAALKTGSTRSRPTGSSRRGPGRSPGRSSSGGKKPSRR